MLILFWWMLCPIQKLWWWGLLFPFQKWGSGSPGSRVASLNRKAPENWGESSLSRGNAGSSVLWCYLKFSFSWDFPWRCGNKWLGEGGGEMNNTITPERLEMIPYVSSHLESQTGSVCSGEAEVSPEPPGQCRMLVGAHLEPWLLLWLLIASDTFAHSFRGELGVIYFHILLRKQAFHNQQNFIPHILKLKKTPLSQKTFSFIPLNRLHDPWTDLVCHTHLCTSEQIVLPPVIKCPLTSFQMYLTSFPFPAGLWSLFTWVQGLPSPVATEQFQEGWWAVLLWASLCIQGCVPVSRWAKTCRARLLGFSLEEFPHCFPYEAPQETIRAIQQNSEPRMFSYKKWSSFFLDSLLLPQGFLCPWIFFFSFF